MLYFNQLAVDSYSHVVPQESCFTMLPNHNKSVPQRNISQFKITINKKHYHPGEEMKGIKVIYFSKRSTVFKLII